MNFRTLPALYLLIFVSIGLALGFAFKIQYSILIISSILILTSSIFLRKNSKIIYFYYVFSIFSGVIISSFIDYSQTKHHNKFLPQQEGIAILTTKKVLNNNKNSIRIIAKGSVDTKLLPKMKSQTCIVSVYNFDKNFPIIPGTKLLISCRFTFPKPKQLKNEFDEIAYFRNLGINWKATAQGSNIYYMGFSKNIDYYRFIAIGKIDEVISELYPQKVKGIVKALLTGDRSEISTHDKNNFSISGTAHILAVSGLHVGIISAIIFLILGPIRNHWIKLIVFSIAIFLFVILTGFQPSGIRAALMAIFVMMGFVLEREIAPLNIFALAILLAIIFEPTIIIKVGFQMSFMAVLTIIMFYNTFYQKLSLFFNKKNRIANFINSSLSITLSASIGVSPVIAYYFGIYSVISVFANLIIIPLMSLAMVFSIVSIVLSFIWIGFAEIYALSSQLLIEFAQEMNRIIVQFPFAMIEGELVFIISILFSVTIPILFYSKNKVNFMFRILNSIAVFAIVFLLFEKQDREDLKVFTREQFVAIESKVNTNQTAFFVADRMPSQYPYRDYYMEQYIIEHPDSIILFYSGNAGINLMDFVKKERNVIAKKLSKDLQLKIKEELKSDNYLHEIIEYDYKIN